MCSYEWCWLCGGSYQPSHFNSLNPFGCASLQYKSIKGWRLFLHKMWILFTCILLAPLFLLISAPIFLIRVVHDKIRYWNCLNQSFTYICVALCGLILQPFVDVIMVVGLIPGLIFTLFNRRKAKQMQLATALKRLRENQIIHDLEIKPNEI